MIDFKGKFGWFWTFLFTPVVYVIAIIKVYMFIPEAIIGLVNTAKEYFTSDTE